MIKPLPRLLVTDLIFSSVTRNHDLQPTAKCIVKENVPNNKPLVKSGTFKDMGTPPMILLKPLKKQIAILACIILSAAGAFAQAPEMRKKQFNLETSGLAIQGYDPVAYFTVHKAIEGKKEFSANYNGVSYHFTSKANQEEFTRNPVRYEPQFGGWCAYAMGKKGEKVEVDPETFKVLDGKLYLFYNKYLNNTLKSWNQDEARLKAQANKNWTKFVP